MYLCYESLKVGGEMDLPSSTPSIMSWFDAEEGEEALFC